MGKNSKKRRDAKRRRHGAAAKPPGGGSAGAAPRRPVTGDAAIRELLGAALDLLRSRSAAPRAIERAIDALVDIDGLGGPGVHRPERMLATSLAASVTTAWEHGWEPLDLHHVARRQGDAKLGRLAIAVIAAEGAAGRDDAPQRWRDQLDTLDLSPGGEPADALVSWRRAERIGVADALDCGLRLLLMLSELRGLDPLGDPPSSWHRARPGHGASASSAEPSGPSAQPKLVATIRALLAKAESTTFPAEAEAFTAKAQDLMSRYAIDAAMVAARSHDDLASGVRSGRVHIDNPYAPEKVQLLAAVGGVNRVRVVWDGTYAMAGIVGFPLDLELVELLFTSLLVQATRAMTEASDGTSHTRSPSFRRAFFLAYSDRIGERLRQAESEAETGAATEYGTDLVPVLAQRREAVDEVFDRLFPGSRPMKGRMVDARGWDAGQHAADQASLSTAPPRSPRLRGQPAG
ncbi:MAG: DUF2786 domain-containing protein [Acidimicrobiia bacterium]|nr:DUF2786 domain-containing protein [Acidimicrobiia bacterium]